MSFAALIRDMAAAGASVEAIAIAVEAIEQAEARVCASEPRSSAACRQARYRARKAESATESVTSVTETVTRDVTTVTPPSFPRPLSPQTPLTPTPIHPDITTRARSIAVAKPNGFAKWWETYPNKVGKAAAEKAYAAACRKIGGPDPPRTMIDGLERALASGVWDEGFIPHPTTWLNQGRWDDDPAPRNPPRKANDRPYHDKPASDREESLRNHLSGAMAAVDRRVAAMD